MNPIECGQICKSAEQAIRHGTGNLSAVPALIKKIIKNRAWEEREVGPGRVVRLKSLAELITAKPMDGWGEDPKKVEALIKDDPEVLEMWRGATTPPKHVHHHADNSNRSIKHGTTKDYTLSRLKKDAPELFEQVVDKKLSANAAAIKAGFRTKTITVPIDPEKAARAIMKHFTQDDLDRIASVITRRS